MQQIKYQNSEFALNSIIILSLYFLLFYDFQEFYHTHTFVYVNIFQVAETHSLILKDFLTPNDFFYAEYCLYKELLQNSIPSYL